MNRLRAEETRLACRPGDAARIIILSILLQVVPLRRASGEDRADSKFLYYQEDNGRVKVLGSALSGETDMGSQLTLKIGGVYNTISGASPTGAPISTTAKPIVSGSTVLVPVTVSSASGKLTTKYVAVSATNQALTAPTPATNSTSSRHGKDDEREGGKTTTQGTAASSSDKGKLPVAQVHDERYAWNAELSKRFGDNILGVMLYYSTEHDYNSLSGAVTYTREFNKKNTLLNFGVSYESDSVDVFSQNNTQSKDSQEFLLGVTQILDSKTVFNASVVLGLSSGYLGDGYKYAAVNGFLVPEQRPDYKNRQIGTLSLTRFITPLNASVEGEYRYYMDSFGVQAHTVSVNWHQKLSNSVLLTPFLRYYTQSAADFYAVSFTGTPMYYSADYRLSNLDSFGYGAHLSWTPRDWISLDVSYERYATWGNDHVTSPQAYPTANIITTGFRLRF